MALAGIVSSGENERVWRDLVSALPAAVYVTDAGGRIIYFEGTYTNTFSGNPQPTPRYEYNQMMYRLDLADERLAVTHK